MAQAIYSKIKGITEGICMKSYIEKNHFSMFGHYVVKCIEEDKAAMIVEAINGEPGFFAKIIE